MEYNTFGYVEHYGDGEPSEETIAMIGEKAAELGGDWKGCFVERTLAARNTPHSQRPVFQELLRVAEPGDHLVVEQLEDLDENPFTLAEALRLLVSRQVHLHVLDFNRYELDLDFNSSHIFADLMAMIVRMFKTHQSVRAKRALRARRRVGGAVGRFPPLGKRRTVVNGEKLDVWDQAELATIREIISRHGHGESFESIGRDLYERRETTATRRLWAKPRGRGKKLDVGRLRRVYARWPKIQAELLTFASAPTNSERGTT